VLKFPVVAAASRRRGRTYETDADTGRAKGTVESTELEVTVFEQ
jgi:hypothetical protein